MNIVLIIGITGQDGSNLARYLIKNKIVIIHGTYFSENKLKYIEDIKDKITLSKLNIIEENEVLEIIKKVLPDYIFNFSSAQPQFEKDNSNYFKINTIPTIKILDSILKYKKTARYFSAGSSLEFGKIDKKMVDINDNCNPDNIYGITKFANRNIINFYKNAHNIFAVHAVLFNHDSASRDSEFISKKICNHLKNVKESNEVEPLIINNIFTYRDWSDSRDFVEAIWRMLNIEKADNYILSSSKEYSIYDFINNCLMCMNYLNYEWKYENNEANLIYNDKLILKSLNIYPVKNILGDNTITKKILNWEPKISFEKMVFDIANNNYFL